MSVLVVPIVRENEQNFGPAAQHPVEKDARLGLLVSVFRIRFALFWSFELIRERFSIVEYLH